MEKLTRTDRHDPIGNNPVLLEVPLPFPRALLLRLLLRLPLHLSLLPSLRLSLPRLLCPPLPLSLSAPKALGGQNYAMWRNDIVRKYNPHRCILAMLSIWYRQDPMIDQESGP